MRIQIAKGSDLFGELQKRNINISAFCGGREKCGKCKVRIVEGVAQTAGPVAETAGFMPAEDAKCPLPVTETEQRLLTARELEAGIRLACCHRCCEADVVVEAGDESQGFQILGSENVQYDTAGSEDGVGIAVDIGTTTLVIAEIDLRDGRLLRETKVMNPQRKYGADVISRIQACNDHGVAVLQQLVLQEIRQVILSTEHRIKRMYVCGNSTMEHIFLGIEPRKISEYPYVCEFEELQIVDARELFFGDRNALVGGTTSAEGGRSMAYSFPVVVFPNIAAFVGGDVVAGIVSTEMDRHDRRLLIDLGTNGEMALSRGGVIYTTSTAAGPAFEGGNMLCGVASIPGAICRIQMDEEDIHYRTIGDRPPMGICGSGYIEGISEILSHGLMDETGYMEEALEIDDGIRIVPADIRNFQLAKSAVRSGINILCRRAGIAFSEIEQVYISGGFGKASNLAALVNLKIIPREFLGRTRLLGNTALDGTARSLLAADCDRLARVKAMSVNVDLASDERFNDEYMENMWF